MMRVLVLLCAAVTLYACRLPNPYSPPTSPQQPAPGGAPTLPSPPPQQTPPPVETYPETQPTPPPQPQKTYELGAAARSLVEQAHSQAATGNYAVAASSIERALRIEPNNPLLWIELGQVRQSEGNFVQAENLARKFEIGRDAQDEYALRSQQAAKRALDSGVFADEITPVEIKNRKGTTVFDHDDHMRPETTMEGLAKLRPAFSKDGFVTAGNASGIVDGAASLVIADEEFVKAKDLQPLGRIVSWAYAGVEPEYMGIGPVPASLQALEKAGLKLSDMDLVEVNEAFAAQYLAVEQELGLDRARTNVNGGAIALGHPLAATGTRLVLTMLLELRRRNARYGLATACIGGGQGIAIICERA